MPITQETQTPNITNASIALGEKLYERELELCVKAGGDEKKLREEGYNVFQLEQIRQGLEGALDVSVYMHPQYSWLDMEEIRKGLMQGIDMKRYRDAGYSTEQKREIRKGIARGVDVSQYDKQEYLGEQMREIRYGLMDGLPVIFYNNPSYNALQMQEIRLGLKSNFDISVYAKPEIPYLKMRTIRRSMEDGLQFSEEEIASLDDSILEQLHKAHVSGVDIRSYLKEGYNDLQLEQIRISLEERLDFEKYIRKDMRGESLKEIRLGLEAGVNVEEYAKPEYRWRQMREIRLGLEARLDISKYNSAYYDFQQMREIRLGLEAGLDVDAYRSLVYTAYDMRMKRHRLEKGDSAWRRTYKWPEVPAVYDMPILPYVMRPDAHALRAALEKEKQALADRKKGIAAADGEHDAMAGLMPRLPDPAGVPLSLFGGDKRGTAEEIAKIDMHGHTIALSEDKMACFVMLPEPKPGITYTEEMIRGLLQRSGVTSGIDDAAIRELVAGASYNEQIIVARGKKPENGTDGKYEYHFDRSSFTNPELSADGTADFSKVHFFSEVHAGDIIATYVHAKKGVNGYTVTGEVLPARNGIERPLLKGRGFLLLDDHVSYAAAVSGVAKTNGYELNINRLLTMEDNVVDVNRKIEFHGSIWIKCEMIAGTEIIADGDVIMEGVAQSVRIKAGGDIVVKEGATGRTRGRIEAGGTISGKYFANYELKAHGSIFANSFLHCLAETEEKVVCFGDNGTIYGGNISARLGLECAVVGTESGTPTRLTIGITSEMLDNYNKAEKQTERIASELATLEGQMEKIGLMQAKTKEQMQLKIKIHAAHAIKQKEYEEAKRRMEELADYIHSVAGAEAIISGTLYAGTTISVDESETHINETRETRDVIIIKGRAKEWLKTKIRR